MAKRARGTTTRPGQRAPLQRTLARPTTTVTSRPATLTADEEARAAELEAHIVAEERQAEAATRRTRSRRDAEYGGVNTGGSIALRASEEYRYVARDLRRVTIIGGGLIMLLIALWAIATATGFRFA